MAKALIDSRCRVQGHSEAPTGEAHKAEQDHGEPSRPVRAADQPRQGRSPAKGTEQRREYVQPDPLRRGASELQFPMRRHVGKGIGRNQRRFSSRKRRNVLSGARCYPSGIGSKEYSDTLTTEKVAATCMLNGLRPPTRASWAVSWGGPSPSRVRPKVKRHRLSTRNKPCYLDKIEGLDDPLRSSLILSAGDRV